MHRSPVLAGDTPNRCLKCLLFPNNDGNGIYYSMGNITALITMDEWSGMVTNGTPLA